MDELENLGNEFITTWEGIWNEKVPENIDPHFLGFFLWFNYIKPLTPSLPTN